MIFCPNCGSSYPEGTKFCSKCGSKLAEAAQPAAPAQPVQMNPEAEIQAEPIVRKPLKEKKAAPKLNLNPKLIAIAAAALVLIILLITFIPKIFSGGSSTTRSDYVQAGPVDEEWQGFGKSGKIVKLDNENSIQDGAMSADGTKLIMLDNEKVLYLFDGSKFTKIAEEVKSFLLSFDGKSIAYIDEEDALYLYTGSKAKQIAEDVKSLRAISPDGKAVAYTKVKDSDDTVRGYYYDGKEHDLGKNITPYALSAKGTYVYYKKDSVLYVQKGEDSDNRQKIGDSVSYTILNADGTQILANVKTDDGTRTYFSVKGGERKEITKQALKILLPNMSVNDGTFAGVKDLKNQLYYTYSSGDGYGVYKVNSKLEAASCVKNAKNLVLQEDGKTITYLKNDKLYLMNTSSSDPEGKVLASDVTKYISSLNGKLFLYENEEKETFSVNTSGKSQKVIGESVTRWTAIGSGFLYILDEELYFTTGSKGSKVSGISDEVQNLSGYRDYALIQVEDVVYFTKDGKKVTKLIEHK